MSRLHFGGQRLSHLRFGQSQSIVRVALAVVALLSALGGGLLLTSNSASAAVGWEATPAAAPLPSLDAPNSNPSVNFGDVACASDGTCVAVGTYASGDVTPATLDTTYPGAGGAWSATEPPLPSGFPTGIANQPDETFSSAACYDGSPGTCIAVGTADDGTGNTQGVIDTFSGGTWTSSIVAPLPAGAATAPGTQLAGLAGVTCPSPGSCVAVGSYDDGSGSLPGYGLIDTLSGVTWDPTQSQAPGGGIDSLYDVACASPATCVAIGQYKPGKQPFVDILSSGAWTSTALPLPTSPAATSPSVGLLTVNCASDNTCAAIGKYEASAGTAQVVYSSYQGGAWGVGLSYLRVTGSGSGFVKSFLDAVACPSAGTCFAAGGMSSPASPTGTWLETYTGGTWSSSFPPVPAGGGGGVFDAIICAADGSCAAVGSYGDVSGNQYALVDTYQANTWSAYPYPPSEPADANPASTAELTAVACPSSVNGCTAFGDYINTANSETGLIDSTVSGASPTITMSASAFTSSTSGTYAVTLNGGSGTPSGSVYVTDDQGDVCSTPITLSGGSGSCSITNESAGGGPYTVTADYSGDSTYVPVATALTLDPELADGSGDVTASAGAVTAVVSNGAPNSTVVTAAQYSSDPVATSPPDTSGAYVDVALTNSTPSTSVMIIVCSSAFSSGDDLYWYDSGSWDAITPTTYTAGSPGCLSVTLSSSTTPTPGQLIGTVFGAGAPSTSGLTITNPSLPGGTPRVSYSAPLQATGGNPPYKWSVSAGSLPKGLHLARSTGVISGKPNRHDSGTSIFIVKVVDQKTKRTRGHPSTQNSATAMFGITIS